MGAAPELFTRCVEIAVETGGCAACKWLPVRGLSRIALDFSRTRLVGEKPGAPGLESLIECSFQRYTSLTIFG